MADNFMNENEDTKIDLELVHLDKKQVRKKLFILGVVVLTILAGLVVLAFKLYTPPIIVEGCSSGDIFSKTTGLPCKEVKVTPCVEGEIFNKTTGEPCIGVEDKTATPGTGSPTYQAALKTYEGRSVLFDASCVATPATLIAAMDSKIIIANNSQKTLELGIQGKKANLLPYYYMLSSVEKSGEFPVTCNGKTSATVKVDCRIFVKSGESFPCP